MKKAPMSGFKPFMKKKAASAAPADAQAQVDGAKPAGKKKSKKPPFLRGY